MRIDTHAPLVAKKEIIINVPVENVWNIQSDIAKWPSWQKNIPFVRVEGMVAKGTVFIWKTGGLRIRSVLTDVTPYRSISWTGNAIGMHAVHNWKFTKEGNMTRVVTEESLSGWLAHIIKFFYPSFLDKIVTQSLHTLKYYAEAL